MKRVLILLVLIFFSWSISKGIENNTEKEILHLFGYLENSNCEFNRNGSWYSPYEAAKHLTRKYRWLVNKGLINSAEQFIERAASRSSFSGESYLVRCGNSSPIKSSDWFTDELNNFRETYNSTK
jgi:hypothetical protein